MADADELAGPLEERWDRYTVDQLLESCVRMSQAVARKGMARLVMGALAAGLLLLFDRDQAALVVAVLALGFAVLPGFVEITYQTKLTAGGMGMLVEEVRSLHLRLSHRESET